MIIRRDDLDDEDKLFILLSQIEDRETREREVKEDENGNWE